MKACCQSLGEVAAAVLEGIRPTTKGYVHRGQDRLGRVHASKLSPEDVQAIRKSQEPQRWLARRYGVSQTNISKIKSGLSWREAKLAGDNPMTRD